MTTEEILNPAASINEPAPAPAPPVNLEAVKLCERLDEIAENARYAADPREKTGQVAAALADYFRSTI